MLYRCPVCLHCEEQSIVEIDVEGYHKWRSGMLLQDAFPGMDLYKREMLLTGTHPKCWEEMFEEFNEEEVEYDDGIQGAV